MTKSEDLEKIINERCAHSGYVSGAEQFMLEMLKRIEALEEKARITPQQPQGQR